MPQPFVSLICAGRLRPWLAGAAIALGTFTARGDWQLVWSDEFNGVSIDTKHWKFEIGNHHGWGNHEWEYYTDRPENVCVSNGVLHIVARSKPADGVFYTSARLKSQGLFAQKYGRFEFRAKFPGGQGYWPALWLMPEHSAYGRWPASGEIDVMENRGNSPREGTRFPGMTEPPTFTCISWNGRPTPSTGRWMAGGMKRKPIGPRREPRIRRRSISRFILS
jgi:beta-glucanase (GH16 family)